MDKIRPLPPLLKRFPHKYFNYDPYWGDEEQAVMRKIELVLMWQESGLIEGSFAKSHLCLAHVAIGIEYEESGDRDPYEFTCEQAAAYRPEAEGA